jgi:hypothetical protein
VRKVTEFEPSTLRVSGHAILEETGAEICRAHIIETREIARGVVIPRMIVFSYPAEGLELKMTLGHRPIDVVLNQQFGPEQARILFTRPTGPSLDW